MEMTVRKIVDFMEQWAPLSYAESYDNPGLIVGREDAAVSGVRLSVDASESVIRQAIEKKADLLLAHHPLIFHPLRKVSDQDLIGKRVLLLAESRIALYAAHTNLDSAPGGNIDRAAALLGLTNVRAVGAEGEIPCLRIGQLEKGMTLKELADHTAEVFSLDGVRVIGDPARPMQKVALVTGSGMDFADLAADMGADVLLTGDITYHKADEALSKGLSLIDATHFGTDRLSLTWIRDELSAFFSKEKADVEIWIAEEEDPLRPLGAVRSEESKLGRKGGQ